jgi:hypothetical protein
MAPPVPLTVFPVLFPEKMVFATTPSKEIPPPPNRAELSRKTLLRMTP